MTRTSLVKGGAPLAIIACLLLAGCSGETPLCDATDVADGVRSALIQRAGLVREKPDFTCFGGCAPYLEGDKVQFISLETDPGNHKARSLQTFAVNAKDFFRALDVKISDIRVLEKNPDAKAIGCAAKTTTNVNWTVFDQNLLSKEVVLFGNFDGHVAGWNTQYAIRSTVKRELENAYGSLLWNLPVEYVAQYSTDGKLFVDLD